MTMRTVRGDPDRVAEAAARLLGGRVEIFGRFGTRRIIAAEEFRIDVATTRTGRTAVQVRLDTNKGQRKATRSAY